ncbi:hypothetical protein WICPIJ_003224, partial [Wickerhamomyces pijperi]
PASPDSPDSPAESVKSEDQPKQTDEKINIPLPDAGYSPVDRMMELGDGEDNTELLAAQETERTTVLEQQLQDRPLAKLQENLDKI